MTLGEKLSKLRRENNYTQEQLADVLGVSRQSISKWESDVAYPETDKLIRIGEIFDCSLDYLLKDGTTEMSKATDGENAEDKPKPQRTAVEYYFDRILRERKSEKTVCGMPLWHIGKKARGFVAIGLSARGVIAIGLNAQGIISVGMLSIGVVSIGMLALGLLAGGVFAVGLLSAGCFSLGAISAGSISVGFVSFGAIAIGDFSVGALSIGKYFAIGDNARAMIALGDTEALGTVFQKIGERTVEDYAAAANALDTVVPPFFVWAKELIKSVCLI